MQIQEVQSHAELGGSIGLGLMVYDALHHLPLPLHQQPSQP